MNMPRHGFLFAFVIASTAMFFTGNSSAAQEIRIGGTGAALGSMQLLGAEFSATNPDIQVTTVPSLGSGGSIKAVLAGAIGLAVTSRAMNESDRKLGAVEMEYARTPFVFAVSTKSKVSAISSCLLYTSP